MQEFNVPGMAYAILKGDKVVSEGVFGEADVEKKLPVTHASVFPIASLSKPIVAFGIMSLWQDKKLDIYKPLSTYLTGMPAEWQQIPLVRLLDHTSGIPDQYNSGEYDVNDPTPISSDEVVMALEALPLEFSPPGSQYMYSNGNYVLLAKIIEKVTGMSYGDFLKKRVFTPLGMTKTHPLQLTENSTEVQGYETVRTTIDKIVWNPDWVYGNGQLGATIDDLVKFAIGVSNTKIVNASTFNVMLTPPALNDGSKPEYALGWGVGPTRGAAEFDHSGKVNGWRSKYICFTDSQVTVIVLSNNGTPTTDTLANDLAATVDSSLSLNPTTDTNTALTTDHLRFVLSIKEGNVDTSKLSSGLLADYNAKDHWKGLTAGLAALGSISWFRPTSRTPSGTDTKTIYRLQQGPSATSITIWNMTDGTIDGLMISHE
jgi:CubicO group peptidase (beta-lactamase class C family)